MTTEKFKESDIVRLIKGKEHLFGDIGASALIFEKAIMQGATIMDCMIVTEKKGVIGVEIKTERDSTQRLNKQIENYSKVCDYVYVMCHDTHVAKVEKILKSKKYTHVGIIAYIQIGETPYVGVYKEPQFSPIKDVYHTLNILWRAEISDILGTFKHPARRIEQATNGQLKAREMSNRGAGIDGLYKAPIVSRNDRKPNLINALISRVGHKEANKIFCHVMMHPEQTPDKAITLHHFNLRGDSTD